ITQVGHRAISTPRVKVSDLFAASPGPDKIKLRQLKRGLQDTFDFHIKFDEQILSLVDLGVLVKVIEDSERIKDELFLAMSTVDRAVSTLPPPIHTSTAIHDNPSLTTIDKFPYLQSLLEGKAKQTIAGLALTDANYSTAVDLLVKRFGSKERITAAHMDVLMSLDIVSSDHHIFELCRLSLSALVVPVDSYRSSLAPLFIKKFPSELRLAIVQ
uniref:Uncharacterized protein n=1 Tax=Amphimedon queenslandica TaxID=400682 RepID=A0A1X7UMR7_AMPQE